MDLLKSVADSLLNPKSRLEKLRRSDPETGNGSIGSAPAGARGRLHLRKVVFNFPLMMGMVIVLGLFILVLFGPVWAPKNPYIAGQHIVPHFDFKLQEYIRPPLPPSPEFPLGTDRWGNDLLSLLMHGARNTLVACAFITMVRVILGLTLGGLAGWNEGQTSDQLIMGLIVVITSVPMLISSMILIYALDIRKGLPVFIVALSVIGWAEIAQYIRSEFMVLRKMPYIEGARAVGLSGLGIAVRHVLPNVLPQLLVISFLEMGAVMMLLGELGFVGVFIGGGSRLGILQDMAPTEIFTLMEVPEWGAMLADGFRFLRSKPFVVFPPAVAFFVSVVGFNALGEGLRRLIEKAGLNTSFLLRKRMLLVIAGLTFATVFIINNTGPAPWFAKVAQAFNGDFAYEHVKALTEMDGRGIGQDGGAQAAAYIAEKFAAYGLEPGWKREDYIYPLDTQLVQPLSQPYLALMGNNNDGQPLQEFRHQLDFGFVIEGHGGGGDVEAPLTFVGFRLGQHEYTWESFQGLDLRDQIVVLLEGNVPPDFVTEALIRGARGVLWISGDGRDDVRSQIQLADPGKDYLRKPHIPIFRIRPSVASAIVEQSGGTMTDLFALGGEVGQSGPGWFTRDLRAVARMSLTLTEPQEIEIPCVLAYKRGSDFDLAGQLVVLFAAYDGLGMDPDGAVFPAANHNASGVGILLEMARLWQEQNLNARRSVLFVAWGGGQLDDSGARGFLGDGRNFPYLPVRTMYRRFAPTMIFQLDYLGAGDDTLYIHPNSSDNLGRLLAETATEVGISIVSEGGSSPPYDDIVPSRSTQWLYFTWSNPEVAPDEDSIERIEADNLRMVGEAFTLALTRVVRQASY
ncbi:MAG: ABC transporter permease subunit [Anaerolineales bacterium]|nr:ABC transporter permease subunit [Anaerolineales bacterium]